MTKHTQAKPAGAPTWTDVMTPDPDKSRAFYHAVFGWEYDIAGAEFGGYTNARVGPHMTAGIVGSQPGAPPMPAAWTLHFSSRDIEADAARVAKLGGTVLGPVMSVGDLGKMAVCADPAGATFGLWQAGTFIGAQITDEPGSTMWHELYTSKAAEMRAFYSALLGASADPMPGAPSEYYMLKQGDAMLAGIMQILPAWGAMPAQWNSTFIVADVEAAAAAAVANGGQQLGGIDPSPFGRIAALRDPFGANFKIIQPAARG